MTAPRTVSRQQVCDFPYVIWNEYVALLGGSVYRDLTPTQRPAHLVFWYENEVQTGGHLQYFENHGVERVDEVVSALRLLGADCQAEVLTRAVKQYFSRPRTKIKSIEEFVGAGLAGEYNSLDHAFYACQPELPGLLEAYLKNHQAEFVVVSD
jgi:hypothetical protein